MKKDFILFGIIIGCLVIGYLFGKAHATHQVLEQMEIHIQDDIEVHYNGQVWAHLNPGQ